MFAVGLISRRLIDGLVEVDVTIFLSVLHHILGGSGVYSYNSREWANLEYAQAILRCLCQRTQTLFFEMGQPEEAHDWARWLPSMTPSPAQWIPENLLRPAGFSRVMVINPPDWRGPRGR